MGLDDVIKAKREAILWIAQQHGVSRIRVFGSVARGEATEDSDVDLLIEVAGPTSLWFPGGLVAELEALLGRRVDVVWNPMHFGKNCGIECCKKRYHYEGRPYRSPPYPGMHRGHPELHSQGRDTFLTDWKTCKATLRELQELAESTQQISAFLRGQHPEVPWPAIAGFRNVLVHNSLGLSVNRIWEIIERDLPSLRVAVETMLSELERNGLP